MARNDDGASVDAARQHWAVSPRESTETTLPKGSTEEPMTGPSTDQQFAPGLGTSSEAEVATIPRVRREHVEEAERNVGRAPVGLISAVPGLAPASPPVAASVVPAPSVVPPPAVPIVVPTPERPTVVRAPMTGPAADWPAPPPLGSGLVSQPVVPQPPPPFWPGVPAVRDPAPSQSWPGQVPPPPAVVWAQHASPGRPPGRAGGGVLVGVLTGVLVACLLLGAGAVGWFVFLQPEESGSTADSASTADTGSVSDTGTSDADTGTAGSRGGPSAAAPPSGATLDEEATTSAAPSTTSSSPTTPALTAEQDAVADLNALVTEARRSVVLDGRWVAQVASKNVGTRDPLQTALNGTHDFYGVDILWEVEVIRQRLGGSPMFTLLSTDFGRRSVDPAGNPYWTSVVDAGFSGPDGVRAWCASTFPEMTPEQLANACVPRTLDPPHD